MTNQEFLIQVGMEVRVARTRQRLSAMQLGKMTGMSNVCILMVERGEVDSHILTYKRIADALGIDIKELLRFAE